MQQWKNIYGTNWATYFTKFNDTPEIKHKNQLSQSLQLKQHIINFKEA